MKILNIFKKKSKSVVKLTNVQKLEKKQLGKIVGGAEEAVKRRSGSVIATNSAEND
jgi:hypothetical protein